MSDLAKFTDNPRMKEMVSHLLLVLTGSTSAEAPAEDEVFYGDSEVMVEALSFLAALLIEADPAAHTNRLMRLSAEEIARRAANYARAIRTDNERTGQRLLAMFAGADDVIAKPDATH